MFALKNRCAPELSEASSHARVSHSKQLLENIHPMMLASFCSLTKTYLQWPHEKPTEWPLVRTSINQGERCRNRTHTINIQLAYWWHQVVDITRVWHMSTTDLRLVRSINRNVMLLQQFLPAICTSDLKKVLHLSVWRTVPRRAGNLRYS